MQFENRPKLQNCDMGRLETSIDYAAGHNFVHRHSPFFLLEGWALQSEKKCYLQNPEPVGFQLNPPEVSAL
jgi:hypothetical protein